MTLLTILLFILPIEPTTTEATPSKYFSVHSSTEDSTKRNESHTLKDVSPRAILEDSISTLYSTLHLEKYDLNFDAFRYAMIGYMSLHQAGRLSEKNLLTIIDFTKPSTEKRFYTIDLNNHMVKFHSYVSHGKNSGGNIATSFSNRVHSNQSSLGFYITAETYTGSKGYSLKLDGMDKGYNDNMRQRAVVMHEAPYVSETWIKQYGKLGRSQGCPALPREISKKVIDTIKNQTLIFAYYNDPAFLQTSAHLNIDRLLNFTQQLADVNLSSNSN